MKLILTYIFFGLLLPIAATAQTKQKAEAAFVAGLNNIIKNSPQQHWAFAGYKMMIDSPYVINKKGILSVTVSYQKDSAVVITRTEAPVNKIARVAYDLYIILEFNNYDVSTFTADNGSTVLRATEKADYFHIGLPLPEDSYQQEKLQKLLDNLLKYYKN